jgi:hypothetical protein
MRSYSGHTIIAMSGVRGSTQLTLHLQSSSAAAAAQHAAEEAAAAVEAAATWQVHQVRHVPRHLRSQLDCVHSVSLQCTKHSLNLCATPCLVSLEACWHSTGGLLCSQAAQQVIIRRYTWTVTVELYIRDVDSSPAPVHSISTDFPGADTLSST